jgi:hypothetical protein
LKGSLGHGDFSIAQLCGPERLRVCQKAEVN